MRSWSENAAAADLCWDRAAELTFRLGGRWKIEPSLIGWRARAFPAAPGGRFIWALTLPRLCRRIQDPSWRPRPAPPLPWLAVQRHEWLAWARRPGRTTAASRPAGAGPGGPEGSRLEPA